MPASRTMFLYQYICYRIPLSVRGIRYPYLKIYNNGRDCELITHNLCRFSFVEYPQGSLFYKKYRCLLRHWQPRRKDISVMYEAKNIGDIIRNNEKAGWFFFHPKTMKFFHSRVSNTLFENNTFVTSELHPRGDRWIRLYTVRKYNPENAWIDTIGEFGGFTNRYNALKFAQNYNPDAEV